MSKLSRPPDYFERLYAANPDPWDFETSAYEQEKYAATMVALGGRRFGNALEIGCSIGVLTALLAACCDRLLAVDVVDTALAKARARCANFAHVRFETRRVPGDWPAGGFDLIVVSEVLYFLNREDIDVCAARAVGSLAAGGYALLVNYTEAIDEPCGGDESAERFIAASRLALIRHERREKYRIDLLRKPDGAARQTGADTRD